MFLAVASTTTVCFLLFSYPFKLPLYEELGFARYVVEPIIIISPFCAMWMAYQAIRHEPKPLPYVVLAMFVPFAFVWYYIERVRPRSLSIRNRVPADIKSRPT